MRQTINFRGQTAFHNNISNNKGNVQMKNNRTSFSNSNWKLWPNHFFSEWQNNKTIPSFRQSNKMQQTKHSSFWFNKTIIVQTKQQTQAFQTVFFKQNTQLMNKFKTVLLLEQLDNIPQTRFNLHHLPQWNDCLARTINSKQWNWLTQNLHWSSQSSCLWTC